MKSYQKNIFYFLSGITSLITAFLTMQGTVQKYIYFDGILNEIAFCFILTLLGISLICNGIPAKHFKTNRS